MLEKFILKRIKKRCKHTHSCKRCKYKLKNGTCAFRHLPNAWLL